MWKHTSQLKTLTSPKLTSNLIPLMEKKTPSLLVSGVSRPRTPKLELPPHVHCVRTKGREYFYFQPFRGTKRAAERRRLPGHPINPDGTLNTEWWTLYKQLAGIKEQLKPGSVAGLIDAYKASPEWAQNADSTRSDWSRYLEYVKQAWGDLPVKGITPEYVFHLRDAYADMEPADPTQRRAYPPYKNRAAAANNLLRCLSAVMAWSIPRGWRNDNPVEHVPKLKGGDPYEPWLWEEIDLFRTHASKHMWRAAAIALYTGQRLSDVITMGWRNISGGLVSVRDEMGVRQKKTNKQLWVPIHQDLAEILDDVRHEQMASGISSTTVLTNTRGLPWTRDGFKASWQAEMNRPEFKVLRERRRVFHGLRKSAVVFLLEAGCTDAEAASVTGQSREMIEHYARQVNQRKLAAAAILRWETWEEWKAIKNRKQDEKRTSEGGSL